MCCQIGGNIFQPQPLQMFWPGLALFITVMAFNMVGDALRDRLDPHLIAEHAH